jgi:hypothetical protein
MIRQVVNPVTCDVVQCEDVVQVPLHHRGDAHLTHHHTSFKASVSRYFHICSVSPN